MLVLALPILRLQYCYSHQSSIAGSGLWSAVHCPSCSTTLKWQYPSCTKPQSLLSRKSENLRQSQVLSYLSNGKSTNVTGNEAMYSLQVNTTKQPTLFIGAAGLGST